MKNSTLLLSSIIAILTFSCGTEEKSAPTRMGMVGSAHPLATQAGLDVLEAGGNAFDAFIAIASTLNVTEPMMSGLGGYGTILIYDAKEKQVRYLNSSGRIPINTNSDLMRPPTPNYLENRTGAKAVSTPSNLHAWEAIHQQYGTQEWSELFTRAIQLAEEGFVVSPQLSEFITMSSSDFSTYTNSFYTKDGVPLMSGDTLVQRDLGASFRRIGNEGARAFYDGKIADAIEQVMVEREGFLRKIDLQQDTAEWWDPLVYDYKGYQVYTASVPSNAFAAFTFLGLMEQFQDQAFEHNSEDYLHLLAEIAKQSYSSRLLYSVDPELDPFPESKIFSADHLQTIAKSIDLTTASTYELPFVTPSSNNTTHFVVADGAGNIVSATQTLGNLFGSRIMPEGTGIWLNNSLAYCTYEPKGNPMDAKPGHHKLSGDCPVIIIKDGLPWAALGSPGGHTITQNVPQIIFNLIDFEMTMEQAIASPKISFAEPNSLIVESAVPSEIQDELRKRGHDITNRNIGNAHGIRIFRNQQSEINRFEGSADPRGREQLNL